MKTTVYEHEFYRAFEECRPTNFSREGLSILWSYFEELEDSIGEEIELDVIGICCDFTEQALEDIIDSYGYMMNEEALKDKENLEDYVDEFLRDHTQVCGMYQDDSINQAVFVFQAF